MTIYVDQNAKKSGNGSKEYPFQRINEAAKIAKPGDEVLVEPGIYREYVDPVNAGTEDKRITYKSVKPLGAIITGAEKVENWKNPVQRQNVRYGCCLCIYPSSSGF